MDTTKNTILIVDDNANNLKVIAGVLKDKGYNFRMAKSGKLALSILEKTKPDLILLDIQMPEMDGFETCIKIKQNEEFAKIPVVFLTANIDAESIKKAFSVGGIDYVTKPFNGEELLARIKTHIQLKTQAEELELQNATKDKFFSIISHDLKNPLGSILSFSELLNQNLDDFDKDKVKKYTAVIHKSAIFTLDLLQNLLEWSRLQRNSIKAVKKEFNLSDLLHKNIDGLLAQASSKNISISHDFKNNLTVYADEKMVSTVIRNLLSNAIKFTENEGTIAVTSQEKRIDAKKIVETAIIDTGVGIEKENIEKLFKIEENYMSKGTNNEKGTGLGLILCKEFITQNNGTIKVESEPLKGSSFIFTLDCLN